MDTTNTAVPARVPAKGADSSWENALDQAKNRIGHAEQVVQEKTGEAVVTTERYVGSHPWKALAVAGSIGFVVGLLFVSRR